MYPKSLHKGKLKIRVQDEQEEYAAGLEGFERHRNPEINEKEKGTSKEIIRVNPELEKKKAEEAKAKQYRADLIDVAKKAILEDKVKPAVKSVKKAVKKVVSKSVKEEIDV